MEYSWAAYQGALGSKEIQRLSSWAQAEAKLAQAQQA